MEKNRQNSFQMLQSEMPRGDPLRAWLSLCHGLELGMNKILVLSWVEVKQDIFFEDVAEDFFCDENDSGDNSDANMW